MAKFPVFYGPERRQRLRKTWIGAGIFVVLAATGFVGCESSTTVNGETTSKSTIDLLKLIGGPALAIIGVSLLFEGRSAPGDGRKHLSATGASMLVVGVLLFIWGIVIL